jgi:hypothetical protein
MIPYRTALSLLVLTGAVASACSSNNSSSSNTTDAGGAVTMAGTSQVPPTGGTNVEAWLAKGYYKQWSCEPAVHASRSPSVHNFNRICSNDAIASNASGTGDWPVGAAAVKELYQEQTDTTPVGYAVYSKMDADAADSATADGADWYWYERVPLTGLQSGAPHDSSGVVADGPGTSGPALTICVSCHGAAGSDSAHTPSPGGRDFVYTPVSEAD